MVRDDERIGSARGPCELARLAEPLEPRLQLAERDEVGPEHVQRASLLIWRIRGPGGDERVFAGDFRLSVVACPHECTTEPGQDAARSTDGGVAGTSATARRWASSAGSLAPVSQRK